MIPYFTQPEFLIYKGIGIHGWGLAVCIGILLGTIVAARRAEQLGLDPDVVYDYSPWAVISGFIGAHVVEILGYQPQLFLEKPWVLFEVWWGFSSFGGFLGAFVGTLVFRRVKQIRFLDYADSIALGFAPAWMFGRIGCFMAHDHPGVRSDFFLAVKFPWGTAHDLGLYEALVMVVLTGVMIWMRKVPGRGISTGVLLTLYAPARFLLDFLRAQPAGGGDARYVGLTPGQYLCIPLLIGGIALILRARRELARGGPEPAPAPT